MCTLKMECVGKTVATSGMLGSFCEQESFCGSEYHGAQASLLAWLKGSESMSILHRALIIDGSSYATPV